MKKICFLFAAFLISMASLAQKDVTTFLGIPVDGYKNEMKQKLIEKGFTYDSTYELFEGEFNGYPVSVKIVTNNNKVYRIGLMDKNAVSETDIKIRFNNLCQQFENNKRYSLSFEKQSIPDDEDISYQMIVNNKRYEASYTQKYKEELIDTAAIWRQTHEYLSNKYTKEQLSNPTEEIAKDIKGKYDYIFINHAVKIQQNKSVWFMIVENGAKYRIIMFYDNIYNKANGDDL